ncbi:F-box/kelch-repeat protein At3g23880-like [Lotus japonicus]|uniref:F-box/kelch-repeat protein At3g23880-like n=1 Tax=Lotus japonicus TaxID=34305 RepID=UPI00258F6D7E|nr:F-box/kelch-repeat protein At3g23880-like [Lotus japonicus]
MAAQGRDQDDAVSLSLLSLNSNGNSDGVLPLQPILPIEIVEEIICRFPVKFLLQLRCVCKTWNSLISDPKFARRHLGRFNRHFLLIRFHLTIIDGRMREENFMSYPLSSVLKDVVTGATQLDSPLKYGKIIGSCDGIICCYNLSSELHHSFVVWNPSTRKLWELTPLKKPLLEEYRDRREFHSYGFGYDHLSDSFKLVVIFYYECPAGGYKTRAMVHTLGSNSWRRIDNFPDIPYCEFGKFGKVLSGAVNWLACDDALNFNLRQGITSLDLGKESYQELLQPDYGGIEVRGLAMDIMRDCLCILVNWDFWIMNEYGNNESWTKLFSFPLDFCSVRFVFNVGNHSLCVLEDDELLFHSLRQLDVYSYKNGTSRRPRLDITPVLIKDLYIESESLISPCPHN